MKLRLGAAVIAVALSALTTAAGSSPASAGTGTDTTPPEVGSCHDLTWNEAYGESEPLPAVPCTQRHTLVTTQVITLSDAPDWSSEAFATKVARQCYRSEIDFFGGQRKSIQMSTYSIWFFYPTPAQRDAGALWARCDVGAYSTTRRGTARTIKALPTDGPPILGSPPVDAVAKCRKGRSADYVVTTCDRRHALRPVRAVLYPGDQYPGQKRINSWTENRCGRELGRSFGYWSAPTKFLWGVKLRYSLCYKTTTR